MENKSVKEFVFRVDGKDKIVVPSLMSDATSEAHIKLLGCVTDSNYKTVFLHLSHYLRGYYMGLLSQGLRNKVLSPEELDEIVETILKNV